MEDVDILADIEPNHDNHEAIEFLADRENAAS